MCNFKSMILLKDRVFCPDNDDHSGMLRELGIRDAFPTPTFLKVEIRPKNDDPFSPISDWEYIPDQDVSPEWYVEEVDKPRAFAALEEWAKAHIFIGIDGLVLAGDGSFYVKDCKNVEASGSATVKASGSATVEASGSATVEAWGSATVKAWGSATVFNPANAYFPWRNKGKIVLCDNATFKDNIEHIIYQSGDWKLVEVKAAEAQ